LIDLEDDEAFCYLAYERCKGSLLYFVGEDSSLKSFSIVKIFEGAVKGLLTIHQSGFPHRNIRPQYIIIFENSVGKLSNLLMTKEMNENSSVVSISCSAESTLTNVS
jgi:serine/threonine protein kinase